MRTLDNRDLTAVTDYQQDRIEALKRRIASLERDRNHAWAQLRLVKSQRRQMESTLLTVQTECARLAEELRGVKAVELADGSF